MAPTLTHIWLLVDDMPRALGFNRDTLGLKVGSDLGRFCADLRAKGVTFASSERDHGE